MLRPVNTRTHPCANTKIYKVIHTSLRRRLDDLAPAFGLVLRLRRRLRLDRDFVDDAFSFSLSFLLDELDEELEL